MSRITRRASRDMLQARERLGVMWALSLREQETWLPWTKKRPWFPMTSTPQSPVASAPATPPTSGKANTGTGRMKTLNPL